MHKQNINFPTNIILDFSGLKINPEKPELNIITFNKTDYILSYLNPAKAGNKGSNIILKLYKAQEWDEEIGYPEIPDLIIKICKTPLQSYEKPRSLRFYDEITALSDCFKLDPLNTVEIFHFGVVEILNSNQRYTKHRYYTMPYAPDDLSTFLTKNNLPILERISLFLEICDSLKLIFNAGYYHRDIKPDNILFFNGKWKLGDLGLVEHRHNSLKVDESGEWIGPRGWQSPESLNKFITEKTPWNHKFDSKINHQSDLYQLGKVLWFVVQGNCPEGGIDRADFLFRDDRLYQIIKTLLNNRKKRRTQNIDDLIFQLKKTYNIYYKINPEFSLH